MPYVRVWIHLIWSTKNREPLMLKPLKTKLFAHIQENAKKKEIYLDSIEGIADHVHTLISLKGEQSIANVAQLLKGESSHWVNAQQLCGRPFEWQDEYIAVSVSDSQVARVREYIRKQEEHHRKKTLGEEFDALLKENRIGTGLKPS
jgi:putative transposase